MMTKVEEKVGHWRIHFRVIESPFDRIMFIPNQGTILRGTKNECLAELRSWVHPSHYLDILEIEEVKDEKD